MSLLYWFPLNGDLHNQGLKDISLTNANATVVDNGKIGQCYNFSSNLTSRCYSPVVNTTFTEITMCGWAKLDSTATGSGYLFGFSIGGSAKFMLQFNPTGKTINVYGNSSSLQITTDATNLFDSWHHYTVTYDGTQLLLYIDGQYVSKKSSLTLTDLSTSRFYLGSRSSTDAGSGAVYYTGLLNDIRVYDHCLSPKEIEEIAKGLVLHYKLDDPNIGTRTNLLTQALSRPASGGGWFGYTPTGETNLSIAYSTSDGAYIGTVTGTSSTSGVKDIVYKASEANGINGLAFGKTYTFSYFVRATTTNDVGKEVFVYCWNNNSHLTAANVLKTVTLTAEWQKVTGNPVTFKASNPGSTAIHLFCAFGVPQTTTAESVNFQVTKLALTEEPSPTAWIEGGSSATYSTVYDASGYSRNGTVVGSLSAAAGSPRYDTATLINSTGQAASTNYINSPMVYSSSNLLSEYTCAFWLCRTANAVEEWDIYSGPLFIYLYYQDGNSLRIGFYPSTADGTYASNTWNTQIVTELNTWIHITFTVKNGIYTVYKNGQYHAQSDRTGTNHDRVFLRGRYSSHGKIGYSANFCGKLSDLRCYAAALTSDQVKELYNTSMSIDSNGNIHARELVELI